MTHNTCTDHNNSLTSQTVVPSPALPTYLVPCVVIAGVMTITAVVLSHTISVAICPIVVSIAVHTEDNPSAGPTAFQLKINK